ncbi:MAG: Holliday junction resolvase RuvX [Bdellovibrionales bacterium]|nr:Holliday junction resolvase RuvX [Bdellovibrionales bacterium]
MPRILALDVGDARIGVAMSDPLGFSANPLETISREGGKAFELLAEIVKKHGVGTIVVGKPLLLDGTSGEQAAKVEAFSRGLESYLNEKTGSGVSIVHWDERLTTVEAERYVQGRGFKNKDRRAKLDQVSAAIILDAYLQSLSASPI